MKRSFLQSMGLTLALVFLPQVAAAQAVGGDLVILNNGGRLRGVVSEYEPGVHVVIQLPDGTARTVVAADITSVTFAEAVVAPTPPVAPMPEVPAAPAPPAPTASTPAPEVRWTTPRVYESRRLVRWTNAALGRTK